MRRRDRGVVLLFVLAAVAVLSVLAIELASRASVDTLLACRMAREAAFRRTADSGVELGKGLLVEPEAKPFDFWGEPWHGEIAFTLTPLEGGRVRVSDESGKIKIAVTAGQGGDTSRLGRTLRRLFEYLRRHQAGRTEELRKIEGKLISRLGLDEPKEGESPPKPEPLLTLDGLREAGLSIEQVFGKDGLHRYLTCFGDGKINLNTAPRAVLYTLDDDFDVGIVDRIAAYRGDPEGEEGVYKAFQETRDLELVDGIVERTVVDGRPQFSRNLYRKVEGRVTTRSTSFSIRVEGLVGDRIRQSWAFFEPGRIERAGEKTKRTLKRLAYEEILP